MELTPMRAGAVGLLVGLILAVSLLGGGQGVVEPRVSAASPLAGHTAWVSGTVTTVGDGSISISTAGGSLSLRTDDGALFRADGDSWTSVEWSTLSEGERLCLSAQVRESGRLDVVKAFVGTDCVPEVSSG